MTQNTAAGVLAVSLVLTVVFFLLLASRIKRAAKFVLNTAVGFIAMAALNCAGVYVPVNVYTCIICGLLGLPGAALVAVLEKILKFF